VRASRHQRRLVSEGSRSVARPSQHSVVLGHPKISHGVVGRDAKCARVNMPLLSVAAFALKNKQEPVTIG